MNKIKNLLLISCLLLVGCGDTPVERQSKLDQAEVERQSKLDQAETVGIVNGKELYRVELSYRGNLERVYFFKETNQPISTNYRVGKHDTRVTVTVP